MSQPKFLEFVLKGKYGLSHSLKQSNNKQSNYAATLWQLQFLINSLLAGKGQ